MAAFEQSQGAFARGGTPSEKMREYELAQRDPVFAQWLDNQRNVHVPAALQIAHQLAQTRGRNVSEQDILEAAKITTPERARDIQSAGEFGQQEAQETVNQFAVMPKQLSQYAEMRNTASRMTDVVGVLRRKIQENPATAVGGISLVLRDIPGTEAKAWATELVTLQSALALDALMELKNNSPTGASGLGALSDSELQVLKSSIAALQQANNATDMLRNLDIIENKLRSIDNDVTLKYVTDANWYNAKKEILPHLWKPVETLTGTPGAGIVEPVADTFNKAKEALHADRFPKPAAESTWQVGPNGIRYRVKEQ
jgi:hypothetical protein